MEISNKIALKIAKELIAFKKEKIIIDNDIFIYNDMRKYGTMKFPGEFIFINCPYKKIKLFKEDIKKMGFFYESDSQEWYIFHKRLAEKGYNFQSLVSFIQSKVNANSTSVQQNSDTSNTNEQINNTAPTNQSLKLSFGCILFEKTNLCFITNVNELCKNNVGEFLTNLNTFCNECNNIVQALVKKYSGTMKIIDMHFHGINQYEMHDDLEIFNNLMIMPMSESNFNKIEEFFKANHLPYKK